jgi:diguanylate cyclase (GGDEF)-like protein
MIQSIRRDKPFIFWFIFSALIIPPFVTSILLLSIEDESMLILISDVSAPIIGFVSAGFLFFAAQKSRQISKRMAHAWYALGIAILAFALGDLFWGIDELVQESPLMTALSNAGYLLFYPLFFVGIYNFPTKKISFLERVKIALDLSIIMVAATFAIWIFIIGPIWGTNPGASGWDLWLAIAYPIGDLIIFFALLVLISNLNQTTNRRPFLILAGGMIIMIVTDLIYTYQSTLGTYLSGGILDIGWIVSNVLISIAGIYMALVAQNSKEWTVSPSQFSSLPEKPESKYLTILSYLWVGGAFFLLRQFHHSEDVINPDVLFFGVTCIIALVIVRQIIAINENNHLLSKLTAAVELGNQHVSELNITNLSLQQEIIKRKKAEKQLSHDALHDGLTGLPNRVLFMDRLTHAVQLTKRESKLHYSIFFLDIDNFKAINDSHGHNCGDQALIEIGNRVKCCIRSIDTVARLGGDEFIILLEQTAKKDSVLEVVERLSTSLNQSFTYKNKEVQISCSIGVVLDIAEYTDPDDILRDVDIALYRAKENGKSQYEVFTLEMRTLAMSRLQLEGDLRKAIITNELFLVYQPIYALDKNEIKGVEALVRWRHPLRGLVMPSEFIPYAEESGFIIQLGDWVLFEACSQLNKWHKQYPTMQHLTVNVNVSGKQITQSDFIEKVKNALNITGLDPHRLILEITESSFVEHQEIIDGLLNDLRQLGVVFSIDDFGTGYSSLGYLKNFLVDSIKIDKSFIDEIVDDAKGFEIVKTIIQMAQKLGIKTVAEGIENSAQLKKLHILTCNFGQGYYLSRPVPGEQIEQLLKFPEHNSLINNLSS